MVINRPSRNHVPSGGNLNEAYIDTDCRDTPDTEWLRDNSDRSLTATVDVHFRYLEEAICRFVHRHKAVVGCVAWLTNYRILAAMADTSVALVVQKEDFLRPDGPLWGRKRLHKLYDDLHNDFSRYDFDRLSDLSCCCRPSMPPVRCFGNHNSAESPAFPRMHNKFLVGCSKNEEPSNGGDGRTVLVPLEVWTGSFNLTANSTRSLENAVEIKGENVARRYFDEWEQIYGLSEELNWDSQWVNPEWRIGT